MYLCNCESLLHVEISIVDNLLCTVILRTHDFKLKIDTFYAVIGGFLIFILRLQ